MISERQNQSLNTVPNSLRAQLEGVQSLLSQSERAMERGDENLAIVKAREGHRLLAAISDQSPELAALGYFARLGFKGFDLELIERKEAFEIIEHRFVGFVVHREVINLPTIVKRTISARVR